ncbi:MAG: copper chaperone PCu(A)C [Betaproteobacteria bacterium]
MAHVRAAIAAALLCFTAGAAADVRLANAWMRPAAPGDDAAAYVDIRSDVALTLVGATTPVATEVEIAVAESVGGPTKTVKKFDVPAGAETRFAYRGNVLRLVGIKAPLANGSPVTLTLLFRDRAGQTVTASTGVEVRGLVARRPAGQDAPAPPAAGAPAVAEPPAMAKPPAMNSPPPKM